MKGLRRGLVSAVLAGTLAVGGFIGGLMLSGGAATAATGGTNTTLTGTTVASTPSSSATQKPNSTSGTRHTCPHESGDSTSTNSASSSSV